MGTDTEKNSSGGNLLAPGEVVHGYVVERLLAKGGLGEVYLARHAVLDALFALKVLYPGMAKADPEYVKRFLREAKLATLVRHPNLVAVHDCGLSEGKGLYFLVMDYVTGTDLRQAIGLGGPFSPDRAADVVLQVASALQAAQRFNVVHRDIKPENIMLQPDGTVRLVDLGIAKATFAGDSLKTMANKSFGTPAYVAPEQALCAADVDQRADIYSLGIVLFEMVVGKCPYEGKNPTEVIARLLDDKPVPDAREFNGDVPEKLSAIIRRMCEKNRDHRIPSAAALIGELAAAGYGRTSGGDGGRAVYTPTKQDVDLESFDLSRLPDKADDTLSFDTDDKDIQRFVAKIKRRRLIRRAAFAVAILALVAVAAAVLSVVFIR